MWGIFEVFFDTFVVCTCTAFAVISTGVFDVGTHAVTVFDAAGTPLDGSALVSAAFSRGFGDYAGHFVSIAILLFAFSTLNGLMAIPNLIGVIVLSLTVKKIAENYVDRKIKKKDVKPIISIFSDIQEEVENELAEEE